MAPAYEAALIEEKLIASYINAATFALENGRILLIY